MVAIRKPLKHVIEGDIVKVYKTDKGIEKEILMDLDTFRRIEEEQLSLTFTVKGYVSLRKNTREKKVRIGLHRFALGLGNSKGQKDDSVDHLDGDILNNLRNNLKQVTNAENQLNKRKIPKHNTSGFVGVFQRPSGRWSGVVYKDGKQLYTGTYDTPEEASKQREEMKRKLLS
jgi:hypothetical protein